ncbi:hypothetical protein J6590_054699 [Homalodisca vitripennis]|nr:hypothetical protein J6590_054699 [Homalodisca vitripennis]
MISPSIWVGENRNFAPMCSRQLSGRLSQRKSTKLSNYALFSFIYEINAATHSFHRLSVKDIKKLYNLIFALADYLRRGEPITRNCALFPPIRKEFNKYFFYNKFPSIKYDSTQNAPVGHPSLRRSLLQQLVTIKRTELKSKRLFEQNAKSAALKECSSRHLSA